MNKNRWKVGEFIKPIRDLKNFKTKGNLFFNFAVLNIIYKVISCYLMLDGSALFKGNIYYQT